MTKAQKALDDFNNWRDGFYLYPETTIAIREILTLHDKLVEAVNRLASEDHITTEVRDTIAYCQKEREDAGK